MAVPPRRILVIAGTRPEVIKLAPVCFALRTKPKEFATRLLVTGQHRQLLDGALAHFSLVADYDLNVMRESQDLFEITTRILNDIKPALTQFAPDCIVVQGDTTSAFVGALAGYYRKATVVHVEAGLRTGDKFSPYPEEMNRLLVGRLADLHFAPTETARRHLLAEGIDPTCIWVTGNTAIDALHWTLAHAAANKEGEMAQVLVTCHRRESFGAPLSHIMRAVARLAVAYPNIRILFPVHPNPEVRRTVERELRDRTNVAIVAPMEYQPFAQALKQCLFVMTDSGGIQEEAAALGKPTLVLREKTERVEGLACGTAVLCGTDEEEIFNTASRLLSDTNFYRAMAIPSAVYGDGHAAKMILDVLQEHFADHSVQPGEFA